MAGFGRVAGVLERRLWADSRARGSVFTTLAVGVPTLLARRAERGGPLVQVAATAVTTWAVLGGRSLEREAAAVSARLEADDLPGARRQLSRIVGRRTEELSAEGVARAAVESVAENTSDAVVAPLVWGGIAGVPGLVAYRAANTLDAMVGHKTDRLRQFGWASARLDDVLNLLPARVAALLAAVLGDHPAGALRAWRRDAGAHPSPNAGPVEASFAGALGVRLGGVTVYASGVEHRPELGDGRPPSTPDVHRATDLARRVDRGALVVAVLLALRPRPVTQMWRVFDRFGE